MVFIVNCKSTEKRDTLLKNHAEIEAVNESLINDLQSQVKSQQIEIKKYQDALTINIVDNLFFKSGDAELNNDAKMILMKIVKHLHIKFHLKNCLHHLKQDLLEFHLMVKKI